MISTTANVPFLPGGRECKIPLPVLLPGVVIFVHGVNSDGEWYEAAERGLCDGLNKRMARSPEQMAYCTPQTGYLTPATYTPELTSKGFLDAERSATTFINKERLYCSNIIRFRWGYKASKREVKEFGPNVWLNENDYWGGGPFANGCTSIADLWADGLNDRLFLWIMAQSLNPVENRDVYACPPRAYYVQAALRLARLIKSIRDKQKDCPITVICHSQGNMVGIGAAFLADKIGIQADNYILNNPPLSLVPDDENMTESWTQRGTRDPIGASGRQNDHARRETLKHFFEMIRARAACAQQDTVVDQFTANAKPKDGSEGFTAAKDKEKHGLSGNTLGRVTLYCNPHDQVISAATVQGIGWRGMSQEDIDQTGGAGVFTQRVFAQGYAVGQTPGKLYDYWNDRWNKDKGAGLDGFWHPPSPAAKFSFKQAIDANTSVFGKFMTVVTAPVLWLVQFGDVKVNALPPAHAKGGWKIPINAPALPEAFLPRARRYDTLTTDFDENFDPGGNSRNKDKAQKDAQDPYDSHATAKTKDGLQDDAPMGNEDSEAQMRYEDRARLRMKARRENMADDQGKVQGEDADGQASPEYQKWRGDYVTKFLAQNVNQTATDHSTIVTNPEHAAKAMAYDVALGVCRLTDEDWYKLRVEADWRYSEWLAKKQHPHAYLSEYFLKGTMNDKPVQDWIKGGEAAMPTKVVNERVWKPIVSEGSHYTMSRPGAKLEL